MVDFVIDQQGLGTTKVTMPSSCVSEGEKDNVIIELPNQVILDMAGSISEEVNRRLGMGRKVNSRAKD